VAVLTAIALVPVLIGAAALAVDLTRIHVVGQQLQSVADAAALAGVVYLPADQGGAQAAANAVATANRPQVRIDVSPDPQRPTRLQVVAHGSVGATFAGVLGWSGTQVRRVATADYAGPLLMGSPCNVFGREDMDPVGGGVDQAAVGTPACAANGKYWAGAMGSSLDKGAGDAFAAKWCTWGPDQTPTDGCDPVGFGPSPPGLNLEHRDDGYVYVVRVSQPGTLRLQSYDPSWVSAGPLCRGVLGPQGLVDVLAGAEQGVANEFVAMPAAPNPRYAAGPSAYCTGDTQERYPFADDRPAALQMTTRMAPMYPAGGGADEGAPLCQASEFPGIEGLTTMRAAWLQPGFGGELGVQVRRTFHRWVDLCEPVVVAPGDYLVRVTTSEGSGANRFALRAWLDGVEGGVAVMARERMQVFANIAAGTSQFHLVRVDSAAAGRTLEIGVFDLGDAVEPIQVELLAPDADEPLGPCTVTGAITSAGSQCVITARREVTNARWVRFAVPIPPDYRCGDDADPARCWVRVRITAPSEMFDATTWTARAGGDPVRLVE